MRWVVRATSATATEFYDSVIPSNLHVPALSSLFTICHEKKLACFCEPQFGQISLNISPPHSVLETKKLQAKVLKKFTWWRPWNIHGVLTCRHRFKTGINHYNLWQKSNITLLPCLFVISLAVSITISRLGITFWQEPRFCVVFSPQPFISWATHAIIDTDTNEYLPYIKIFVYVELKILEYVLFSVTDRCFSGSDALKSGLLLQRYWNL